MKATEHKEMESQTELHEAGEKMHVYEASYLIVPTIAEEKVTEEVSSIHKILEAAGASIITEDFPKLRSLAYKMEKSLESKTQKFNEAYFGWVKFEMPVASISNIKSELEKKPSILRHLIIKTVRENTMYSNRMNDSRTSDGETLTEGVPEEKKVVSREEIDKSIDALVIN